MTAQNATQADLDKRQAELNQSRADETARAIGAQHDFAKAVNKQLVGVPMHDTNVGEVALVVAAVLNIMGVQYGPAKAHGPADAKHP